MAKENRFDKLEKYLQEKENNPNYEYKNIYFLGCKEYNILQKNLLSYSDKLYKRSLRNLKNRIRG